LYNTYYQELLSDALVHRWQGVDISTAFVVAATASGSTIAGLALWSEPGWEIVWGIIAVVAAVASIGRTVLGVTSRVKDQTDLHHDFLSLRVSLENFRTQLKIGMTVEEAKTAFNDLLKTYADRMGRTSTDIVETLRLRRKVQERLNDIMKKEGFSQ
jgi:uncharacterized protein YeeX (DUF496 family)